MGLEEEEEVLSRDHQKMLPPQLMDLRIGFELED